MADEPPKPDQVVVSGAQTTTQVTQTTSWIVESLDAKDRLSGEPRVKDSKGLTVDAEFNYPTAAGGPTATPSSSQTPTHTPPPPSSQAAAP